MPTDTLSLQDIFACSISFIIFLLAITLLPFQLMLKSAAVLLSKGKEMGAVEMMVIVLEGEWGCCGEVLVMVLVARH